MKNKLEQLRDLTIKIFRRWWITVVINLILVVVVITITLAITGNLNRFYYPPLSMEWVTVPAGDFLMGSVDSDNQANNDTKPQHKVYLDSYQIGKYEVTNTQYLQCVKANICYPPYSSRYLVGEYALHPILYVNWEDANTFCNWIGGRLPTEAEWEKAARGGHESRLYSWGDVDPICDKGAENGANYDGPGCPKDTITVGRFMPNGYGLYDTTGNVWEWVSDWYDEDYYQKSPSNNPKGPDNGESHVARGGSWLSGPDYLRIDNREMASPLGKEVYIVGFRCILSS
jgi:eukaryotic-like serine/threonine-protein kinase